jgi:hypothetical protein
MGKARLEGGKFTQLVSGQHVVSTNGLVGMQSPADAV